VEWALQKSKQKKILTKGFSLIEILVVIAILSVFASLTFVSGRRVMQSQDQLAAISILKQSLIRASLSANAKGKQLELKQTGSSIKLIDGTKTLEQFDLPQGFSVNWPDLVFRESGLIDVTSLGSNTILLQGPQQTYELKISLIAEMKAELIP